MTPDSVVYRRPLRDHVAELIRVESDSETFRLTVGGISQSQVSLGDPTEVAFDYARHIARLVDAHGRPGEPLLSAHLGGGALTLPRYVATTRPGSEQYVVESEVELTTDLLGILPLPEGSDIHFVFGDARAVMESPASPPWQNADVTVVDLWNAATIASRVATLEFYGMLARLMADDGVIVVNVLDGPGFRWARRQAATLTALFGHVAVMIDQRKFDDGDVGNVLLCASDRPLSPLVETGWPSGDPAPLFVLTGNGLTEWIGGATVMTDDDATDSPPPDGPFDEEPAGDLADCTGTFLPGSAPESGG